jgi:hypothetical protein
VDEKLVQVATEIIKKLKLKNVTPEKMIAIIKKACDSSIP